MKKKENKQHSNKKENRNMDCPYETVCHHECSSGCVRYIQFNRLYELSNLPNMYKKGFTLYAVDEDLEEYKKLNEIKSNIVEFVNEGKNLYICSTTCGNAKTTWAAKLMLKYFDKTWKGSFNLTRGLFINVPTFLIDSKDFDNRPEYIDRIKEADLVIWDDLAFSELTDFEHKQLLQYIDYRIANKLSNIYTSNVTNYDVLINSIGGRLASRIYNGSQIIEFKSDDFRVGAK